MGSVKDLIMDDSAEGRKYVAPENSNYGVGVWKVSGRFSVLDLKEAIPAVEIKNKAEALTMITGKFFEHLGETHPKIKTCYQGLLNSDGKLTSVDKLVKNGEKSNKIVMLLAHTPASFSDGDLRAYRKAMKDGVLSVGVADVESIFRKGFPLGSSTFKKIFKTMGKGSEYEGLATYEETVGALARLKMYVNYQGGIESIEKLEKLLTSSGLNKIPDPGFIMKKPVYDSTTKFEKKDRPIDEEEEYNLSGLSEDGFNNWKNIYLPLLTEAQINFADEKGLLNIDGKVEFVNDHGYAIVTDFVCTPDENRLMILYQNGKTTWAIPSNKEIQRAIFRKEGIASAQYFADNTISKDGLPATDWKKYFDANLKANQIDSNAVSEYSCELMSNAISEVANRILGEIVFDTKPFDTWVKDFLPYASKVVYEK